MEDKLTQIKTSLEKFRRVESDAKAEQRQQEKTKAELLAELEKVNIDPKALDYEIKKREEELDQTLDNIAIPKELQ